jgi:hypothetical protein
MLSGAMKIFLLAFLAMAACGQSVASLDDSAFEIDDGDKADSARPAMQLSDAKLIGDYKLSGKGTDADVAVKRVGQKLKVTVSDVYALELTQKGSVLVFSEDFNEDCDYPGCSNMVRMYGIVYYKKVSGRWKPTVRLNTVLDYAHPEFDEDLSGEVNERAYYVKK